MLASPAAASRGISKKPARLDAKPRLLAELCHDALLKGVLAEHEGLPPSWLDLLKGHPATWQQLTDAVLLSREDKGPFGPHSTISIVCIRQYVDHLGNEDDGSRVSFRTVLAPATVLPRWFYVLLGAYLESMHATPGCTMEVDGNGGYKLSIGCTGHATSMWSAVCDGCRVERIVKATRLKLFDAFQLNVRDELEEMIANQAAEGTPISDDDDDIEILEMFEEEATEILYDYIRDNACELNVGWFDNVERENAAGIGHVTLGVPHVSMLLDQSSLGAYWK
jgi:hypothetical protein